MEHRPYRGVIPTEGPQGPQRRNLIFPPNGVEILHHPEIPRPIFYLAEIRRSEVQMKYIGMSSIFYF